MHISFFVAMATVAFFILSGEKAMARCNYGEEVIKFSHVTNSDRHPKGIAASLLAERRCSIGCTFVI